MIRSVLEKAVGVEEEVQWLTLKNRSFLLKNRASASHSRATEQIRIKAPSFLTSPSHQNRRLLSSLRKRWAFYISFFLSFFLPFGFSFSLLSSSLRDDGEVIARHGGAARESGTESHMPLSRSSAGRFYSRKRESLMSLRNEWGFHE